MRALVVVALAVAMAGCAAPVRNAKMLTSTFNEAEAAAMLTGRGAVTGSAFMKQRGGGVVTCAGSTVFLIPATEYASERIMAIYGNTNAGSARRSMYSGFSPDLPEYHKNIRTTKCDAQGKFEFDDVGYGDFFVQVLVSWLVGNETQGGQLFQRITVRQGKPTPVIISG